MDPFRKELGEMASYTAALSLPGPMASLNTANMMQQEVCRLVKACVTAERKWLSYFYSVETILCVFVCKSSNVFIKT